MAARDVAARVNHDHERRTDRQRRDVNGVRLQHAHADGQNKEEGSNEFCQVLFHLQVREFG
jgi:hypothetical protein